MNIAESIYEVCKNLDDKAKEQFIKSQVKNASVLKCDAMKKYKVVVFADGSAIDIMKINGKTVRTVLSEKEAMLANCWKMEARTILNDISDLFS